MATRPIVKRTADPADQSHQVIEECERMMLIGLDRDAFLEVALNPPEPTGKLVAALKRHRAAMG